MAFTYYDSSDGTAAQDLVVDLNGDIFIATGDSSSKYLVKKFDSSGNKKWSFGDGVLDSVRCMEVDFLGNVYHAGHDKNVRKINSAGTQVWVAATSDMSNFLAVDIEGNIISGGSSDIEKFSGSDGTKLWKSYTSNTAMTVDLLGNMYLISQWFVKLNKNGERTYRVIRGDLGITKYASSMAVDLQGNIWMAMQMDSNVYKVTQTADAVLYLASDKKTPILCKSIQKNGTDYYVR